jgi:hypothetical protein
MAEGLCGRVFGRIALSTLILGNCWTCGDPAYVETALQRGGLPCLQPKQIEWPKPRIPTTNVEALIQAAIK